MPIIEFSAEHLDLAAMMDAFIAASSFRNAQLTHTFSTFGKNG
ncbi:MAG: hypothetical protein OXD38_09425 [Aestuariivita sp.]|nr:hypothetical protein [Aestuariivita sp.]